MVRFARADGSKGSNKREFEEATPWSAMVSQMKRRKEPNPDSLEDDNQERVKKPEVVPKNESFWNVSALEEGDEGNSDEDCNSTEKESTRGPKNSLVKKVGLSKSLNYVVEDSQKFHLAKDGKKRPWFDWSYEENDRMTKYEGFWIKRDTLEELKELKTTLEATVDAETVRKRMMKAKRKAHKDLIRVLIYEQKDAAGEEEDAVDDTRDNQKANVNKKKKKKDNQKKNNDGDYLERVMFEKFWVTKEGAARLKKLRGDLMKKGVSKEEIRKILKGERRKEEKLLKRETKRVCLRCRRRGHLVSECPEIEDGFRNQNVCICYKCGSTEHKLSECPQASSNSKGDFPHATCYICKKVGHISRQCPDNARGLYPNGGSCRGCGSVVHLAANCPVMQVEQEKATLKIGRIDGAALESLDSEEMGFTPEADPYAFRKQKPKIVKFD